MPDLTPNMGAINAVGSQFNNNVFEKIHHQVNKHGIKSNAKAKVAARATDKAKNDWANSVNSTLKTAHATYAKDERAKKMAATQAARASATAAKKTAAAHTQGVRSGQTAPTPGTPPRTFSMAPSAAQKAQQHTMGQQVNNAHGEALKEAANRTKTMQQQKNYAHGQAINQANQMARASAKVNTPPTYSAKKSVAAKQPAGQFPQAKFPTGASTQPLPTASANHSLPGKPQTFTQGAYTHKPGGIAAAGSRLEAWAQTKTMAVNARRKSQAAGGRDKGLAATAKQFEAKAAEPLSGQAPTTKEE